jgi:hypothetical protein
LHRRKKNHSKLGCAPFRRSRRRPVGSSPRPGLSLALGANLVDFLTGSMIDPGEEVLNRPTELGQASEADRRMHVPAKSALSDLAGGARATLSNFAF